MDTPRIQDETADDAAAVLAPESDLAHEEADAPAPEAPEDLAASEDTDAWQLTLPEVDSAEGATEVPLAELADTPAVETAGEEDEGPGPGDEHLFEVPPADTGELEVIAASVSDGQALPEASPAIAVTEASEAAVSRPAAVPWWPFLVYLGLWVALVVAMVVVSVRLGGPYLPESRTYPPMLLVGLVLAVAGPFTGLGVWFTGRDALPHGERGDLLSAALVRAAAFTLGGVALWWAALVLTDALRLGWI